MASLIRVKLFLLCCLFVIGANVTLIISGVISTGMPAGAPGAASPCPDFRVAQAAACRCGYGYLAEKR